MANEPKTELTAHEKAIIQRATDMLGEHFDAGVVLVTFRRRGKTKRHDSCLLGSAIPCHEVHFGYNGHPQLRPNLFGKDWDAELHCN